MFRRKRRTTLPTVPTKYPAGSFVETEKGYFYIKDDAKRYRLISKRVLDSWSPPRLIQTTEAALKNYRVVARMRFRNGTIFYSAADGTTYLIESRLRRPMVTREAFARLGLDANEVSKTVPWVTKEELALHELGSDLT